MNTQYKKGVLELCVLSLLHKRDCYGYEIDEELDDGTVICACCAAETDEDILDEIRAAHRIPLAVQIRRWARL